MIQSSESALRFIPTEVHGLPSVTEVAIFSDRIELLSNDNRVTVRFVKIARWYGITRLYSPLAWLGFKVRGRPSVADRDWFRPAGGKFFRFYTRDPIMVVLPADPIGTEYHQTLFRQIQNVIASGGFCTNDLG